MTQQLSGLQDHAKAETIRAVPVEVLTTGGRATRVEFHVSPATVSLWRDRACVARVDTWQVRQWLASPTGTLHAGDLALDVDGSLDRERPRVAVSLPDVKAWSLSPAEHVKFLAAVQSAHA